MTTWLSLADLDAHRETLTPIGLALDAMFTAEPLVAPREWFGRSGELRQEELGPSLVWCGVSDGVPFEVVEMLGRICVRLPHFASGDRARLDVLDQLDLPHWHRPFFKTTPHDDGFAIIDGHTNDIPTLPTYWTASHDAAMSGLDFLRRFAPGPRQVLALHGRPPCWFVDGPLTDDFISLRAIAPSLSHACRTARWLSQRYGVSFDVTDSRNLNPRVLETNPRPVKSWMLPTRRT